MKKLLIAGVAIASLAGCTQRLTDFTSISTKSLRMNIDKGPRVQGSSCGFLGFGITIKDAIDDAIQNAPADLQGDMLIDGVLSYSNYFFSACYKVDGNIVATKNVKPVAQIDEDGHFLMAVNR